MTRQVKIRVKKNTILSKKYVKKINETQGEDFDKKKKKKKHDKQKTKFKKPDKKKHKEKKHEWKGSKKDKSSKHSKSTLLGASSKSVMNKGNAAVMTEIMDLLKKNMKTSVRLSELFGKLLK